MARRRKGRSVHGILLLDKPSGCSSNQALQRARRLFNAAKAGHTGSLDPLATGMLPVCFGEATKLSQFLLDAQKSYVAEMRFGVTTHSADSDGDVIDERPIPENLTLKTFDAVCQQFVGDIDQVPPMVSALKVNGQRLYKLARQGVVIEREPRHVTVMELNVLALNGESARIDVRCSKGTYIRSLVADIGEVLGCGAHVTALRRTSVAPFEGQKMVDLSELEIASNASDNQIDRYLLPLDAGLGHLSSLTLETDTAAAYRHGQSVPCSLVDQEKTPVGGLSRVYDLHNKLLGLGEISDCGTSVSPRRVLQYE